MAVWNLGSINLDHTFRVPHIPAPGETIAAGGQMTALGGKGANQSVAAARAGARIHHIGAIGPDGEAMLAALAGYGVDTAAVARVATHTGQAVILVDDAGENAIVINSGANLAPDAEQVGKALADAAPGDTLLLQNETSAQAEAASIARARGLHVIYSAAPFDAAAVRAVLPHGTLLVMNAGEAADLTAAMGALPPIDCLITRGAQGADWLSPGADPLHQPAFAVTPVDTTGAGDTFIGWLAACLDLGLSRPRALQQAAAAAAIQVTRPGAAPAIPTAAEVSAFLAARAP